MKLQIDEVLHKCIEIPGQSGFEEPIRKFLKSELQNYGEITTDKLGSVICKIDGTDTSGIKWMISAHMDVNGFIVHSISENGLIKCLNFGYHPNSCHLQPVCITTNKGTIRGVLYTSSEDQKKPLFHIDVGLKIRDDVVALGVRPGDPIYLANLPFLIGDPSQKIICSPRLDNRMGVFELILLGKKLSEKPPKDDVYLVGTVEEEVGARGAKTAASMIKPDLAIILDVTYDEFPVYLGQGPVITLSDKAVLLSPIIRDFLLELSKRHKMTVQTEVWNIGGTDAGKIRISGFGVPCIPVLTATKNNHTPAEIGCEFDCYEVVKYSQVIIDSGAKLSELFQL